MLIGNRVMCVFFMGVFFVFGVGCVEGGVELCCFGIDCASRVCCVDGICEFGEVIDGGVDDVGLLDVSVVDVGFELDVGVMEDVGDVELDVGFLGCGDDDGMIMCEELSFLVGVLFVFCVV